MSCSSEARYLLRLETRPGHYRCVSSKYADAIVPARAGQVVEKSTLDPRTAYMVQTLAEFLEELDEIAIKRGR